jgi:hypothetical protein
MITLPSSPGPRAVSWQPIDFGQTLPGALGGADQRVNRLGNRWACTVELPPMRPEKARAWSAALVRGLQEGVSWRIRQVGTPTGSPGTVLVKGAGQGGLNLLCDGFTNGFVLYAGQWLSILTGGQRYLHQSVSTQVAGASGELTIALDFPLRVTPADNSPVELGAPMIEGLLADVPGWSLDPDRLARGFSFTIAEAR